MLTAYVAAAVLCSANAVAYYGDFHVVLDRSWGNDPLMYESHSLTILQTWSLQGGERVFYAQPFFRYFRFLQRLLTGDGDPALILLFDLLPIVGILLVLQACARRTSTSARITLTSIGALIVALLWSPELLTLRSLGLSEVFTWFAMPYVFYLAFLAPAGKAQYSGAAAAALSAITRANEAVAHGISLTALLARQWQLDRRRHILPLAFLFTIIALLPLFHNVHYGASNTLMTTSASVVLAYSPAELRDAIAGGRRREVLVKQLGYWQGSQIDRSPRILVWRCTGSRLYG